MSHLLHVSRPRRALLILLAAAALLAPLAPAAEFPQVGSVEVLADRSAYEPGATARLAAVLTLEDAWHSNAHQPTYDYLIPTAVAVTVPAGWDEAAVSYPDSVSRTFAFADEPLDVYEGRVVMIAELPLPETASGSPTVTVAVTYQACDHDSCLAPETVTREVALEVGADGRALHAELFAAGPSQGLAEGGHGDGAATATGTSSTPGGGAPGLALMLLFGVFGGAILNVMPCVLPVLSLKVFGLVKSAGIGRREVVVGSLATTAGILASFWALALFAIGARAAGAAVGWGVQFQQPAFVTFLAVVVVLFCLNLWGLFEIPLPSRLANSVGGGPKEGVAGHFASGLFATLMATPCSAPFLGTAVGFALAQPSPIILAIFTSVGVGMALPYLALAVAPGAAKLLPKPGAWMETVRRVMGFLLAAAAVWLFYVLAGQISPERLAAIELALLAIALFVWLRHSATASASASAGSGRTLARLAAAGIALAVVASLGLALTADAGFEQRVAVNGANGGGERIEWLEFDRAEAEARSAAGELVFVDVTADWCFTCKANERLVLETPETRALFADHGVVTMKADWTNRDDDIAAFLADHGKYSIPFYLLYRPGQEPLPFSELLTKNNLAAAVRAADGA